MANNRLDAVVSSIVEGVRGALKEHDVTFDEFRLGVRHLVATAEAKEIPLLVDLFFNTTICENQAKDPKASRHDLEGPYFREDAPVVTDKIKTMEEFGGDPVIIKGTVKDTAGNPVPDADLWIWSATPDGKYSFFHDNIPVEYYRGRLKTGPNGEYQVESTVPVPYQIKNNGPTGAMLEAMGRHSWRPAHIHYKVRKAGYKDYTTQAYFEGGEWVDDDCCEGNVSKDFVIPNKVEDGKLIVDTEFFIEQSA